MPPIALLTDFGTRDHYLGTMKGVMLGIAPEATLVDITHEVAPQDVLGGALQLAASYRYFPRDTVFLAVIDPGVGSVRRAIAAEAGGFRLAALGPIVSEYLRLDVPEPAVESERVRGVVLAVDGFGNLVTNVPRALVNRFGDATFTVGGTPVPRLVSTYAEMPPGEVCALIGSSNYLEFAVNSASAAARLGLSRGTLVEVRPFDKAQGGRVLK